MERKSGQQGKGAIEILEEAVHLLRLSPASLLPVYYIGTLPFVLGFLYFFADMSRSAFADEYCASASLGLAMLFIWMKCWHTIFSRKIMEQLSFEQAPRWSPAKICRLAAIQTLIQSSGLFVLPIALILTIPFGWSYAFYHNVVVLGDGDGSDVKTICERSWQQAKLWPRQNHNLLFIFFVFGVFVYFNVTTGIFLLPHILKKFFGIETMFTMSGINALNTTFFMMSCGITFLCVDPLVKAVYALRCFYGASIRSGDDLRAELKIFPPRGKSLAKILIIFLCLIPISAPRAGNNHETSPVKHVSHKVAASVEDLDRSIEEVMKRPEFTWRMPREKTKKEDNERQWLLEKFMDWILKGTEVCMKTLGRLIEVILDWIKKLLPETDQSEQTFGSGWLSSVRGFLYLLLIVLACTLVFLLWRILKRREENQVVIDSKAVPNTPDLTEDEIKADDFPVDRWLVLAKELIGKGSLRLAIRAFYLATLARLAEYEVITIASFKSNREYEQELRRRAHEHRELQNVFSSSVKLFDRVWYGMYDVTQKDLNLCAANQERIMALAKKS